MRILAIATAALLVLAATAAASRSGTAVVAPARVMALGADGREVAYATTDCRVHLWNQRTGTIVRLGRRRPCEETSTGSGVAAIAVAGNRALWLEYGGGNIREWLLWTATATRPAAHRLAFLTTEPEDRAPIVVGEGDVSRFGDLLPYAIGSGVVVLHSSGARAFTWAAPGRVTAIAANRGEIAVAVDGGTVYVLDAEGNLERTERFAANVDAVAIPVRGVLVAQWGRTLELRGPGAPKTYAVTASARLADAAGRRAVFLSHGKVRLLNLYTGQRRAVVSGSAAQLEERWLTYASGRSVRGRRLAPALPSTTHWEALLVRKASAAAS